MAPAGHPVGSSHRSDTGLATFTGNFFVVAALAWLVSFLVASLLFRWVELPFLRLKDEPLHRLVRRRDAPPSRVGSQR